MPVNGDSSSPTLARISVTSGVEEMSHDRNAVPSCAETCICSVITEAIEDHSDLLRKPSKQSQKANQHSFVGADVHNEQEQSSIDDKNTTVVKSHVIEANDVKEDTEVGVSESSQDTTGEVHVIEENDETKTTEGSDPKSNETSERPASETHPSEDKNDTSRQTCETMNKEGVGEEEDQCTNCAARGIKEERLEEAGEQIELQDEAVESGKEETEGDHPEKSCSLELEKDSSSILSQRPERFMTNKSDNRTRKQGSRYPRCPKVLLQSPN